MAPKKFGIFKGRSRDQQEPPSTENLLHSSSSCDTVVSPPSPIPSTSRGYQHDDSAISEFALMRVDSDDDDEKQFISDHCGELETALDEVFISDDSCQTGNCHISETTDPRPLVCIKDDADILTTRRIMSAEAEEKKLNYQTLRSGSGTSMTTLDLQGMEFDSQVEHLQKFELPTDDDATSIDVNSIQFDDASSLASHNVRYCGAGAPKKMKKNKPRATRANQALTDEQMWAVPNTKVTESLLKRNCSINELIKWEAIALARGICTLTTNCVCRDCNPGVPPHALTDGDAGIANASFLSAYTIGCQML